MKLLAYFASSSLLTAQRRWIPLGLTFALLLAVTGGTASAAAPTVLANHSNYFPGEDIVVSFAGGPGNATDWIAVYPVDVEPDGDPVSTIWFYVNGTRVAGQGRTEGAVTFPGGLTIAGDWAVYLLANDTYTKLATNLFTVVDPSTALVHTSQRIYQTGQRIEVTFTNGPANPKDWLGIYKEGQTPGSAGVPATTFIYTDGTAIGIQGRGDGTVAFPAGLSAPGNYVIYFLENDLYDILAQETFSIAPPDPSLARVLAINPTDGSSNLPPVLEFSASITNGTSSVVPSTVSLRLDDVVVSAAVVQQPGLVSITYTNDTILPVAGSTHTWLLTAQDDATPAHEIRVQSTVTFGSYRNIVLPSPLHFENFDSVTEGSLPAGWTQKSYTTPINDQEDFGDLGSAAFGKWTVVNAARFEGTFVTYGNPDEVVTDYQRVLTRNRFNVLNGQVYGEPLATGRFVLGNSGYQNSSASQVLYLFTPDFSLTGKTNVHLSFHSLWEQNQDSLGSVEYSINGGSAWLPIAYFLDGADLVTVTNETTGEVTIDAEATFTTEHGDVARYVDDDGNDVGGTYGAFIGAPISPALAPYIQRRLDDNAAESKRIELFALPQADNQAAVRFRFAHAGADSWYFGIDDFGLYSLATSDVPPPALTAAREGADIVLSWPATASGFGLESTSTLSPPNWQSVAGAVGNSHRVTPTGAAGFYRLKSQ